jgi:hypothetical protein
VSGVAVVRHLLAAHTPLTNVVPAASIKAGTLPQMIRPPAISVTTVSSVRRNTVSMTETTTLVTERVQATAHWHDSDREGTDYPGLDAGMLLIRQACPNQSGTINGVSVTSILPDMQGPDLEAPTEGIVARSQDFIVRWHEAR